MRAGTKREKYLAENLAAANVKLTPEEMRAIEDAVPHSQVHSVVECWSGSVHQLQLASSVQQILSLFPSLICMSGYMRHASGTVMAADRHRTLAGWLPAAIDPALICATVPQAQEHSDGIATSGFFEACRSRFRRGPGVCIHSTDHRQTSP